MLTTNNTSYSTKCFDYFANELSKFQTQEEKEYAFQFRSNLIDTMLSEVINLDYIYTYLDFVVYSKLF